MSTDREKRLRLELDKTRVQVRQLRWLADSLATSLSRANIELYEIKTGRRYW